jgi:uncharacterized membrane protein
LLNVIGFLFTFLIGSVWGVTAYRTEFFVSTEPFLILFFIFYVAIAVLFALRQPPNLKGYVDGTLVFGVPLVGFALQAALVYRFEYGLAFSALATGLFYISLATGIWRRGGEGLRMLAESFLALGVVFASLTIPFALDGEWIATAWALEGAAVLWIAVRQQRRLALVFAVLLQFGAGFGFLLDAGHRQADWPLLNSVFMGALFVGLAGLFSAWYLQRHYAAKTWQGLLSTVMLAWGLLWWFGNGFNEIDAYTVSRYELMASLLFTAGSALLLGLLETRLDWRALRYTLYGYAPAIVIFLFIAAVDKRHVFAHYGYIAWPFALGVYYWLLKRRDGISPPIKGLTLLHAIAAWSLVIIASIELYWLTNRIAQLGDAWRATTFAIATVAVLQAIIHPRVWPLKEHSRRYLGWVSYPLIILLCFWSLLSDFSRVANMHPLPYLPLLNPLDIMHIIVLATLLLWQYKAERENTPRLTNTQALGIIAALAFIWINAVLLRSLHHWAGIPYNLDAMANSMLAQASVSIFWTVLGLGIMVLATHKQWRRVWIIAACLLGIVIVKLFTVDLAGRDTLATIISFIVVGVLMLVVGYFSPLPPKISDIPSEKIAT